MPFELMTGDKFACIAFKNLAVDESLAASLDLGEGLWALTAHPFTLDKHWKEWIGKIKAEQVDRCNFFLIVTKASMVPHILDAENKMLGQRVNRLIYGLLLQAIPDHIDGFVLSGAQLSNEIQIRQFGEMRQCFNSNPKKRVEISEFACRQAKIFEEQYRDIETSSVYFRVRRGMSAVTRAISEPVIQDRIHEYVRALEALVKPNICESTKQFIHRCQTFACPSSKSKEILQECYDIRSAVEHMNLVDTVFSHCSASEIEMRAAQRLRQVERLACSVYLRLATSKAHALIFETDASIDRFWSRRDDERRTIWGPPLDISRME